MNPITSQIARLMEEGKKVDMVSPNRRHHPSEVTIYLDDGTTVPVPIPTGSHEEFMTLWHQACAWTNIHFNQPEELPEG